MAGGRFLWRIYTLSAALILLTVVALGALVEQRFQRLQQEEVRGSLAARLRLLRELALPVLPQGDAGELQARLHDIGEESGARLTVIRADGVVAADSEADPATMDNHGLRPEIRQALESGQGEAERLSRTLGAAMLYRAAPVRRHGEVVGFVRAAMPLSSVAAGRRQIRAMVAAAGLVALVLALLLAAILGRRVTRPLEALTVAAENLAAGHGSDTESSLVPGAPVEFRQLDEALRRLARNARERLEIIAQDRNQLHAILSSLAEGVVAVDASERVVHLNAVAAGMLRAPAAASAGRRLWEVTRVTEVSEALAAALRDGVPGQRECRIVDGSGERRLRIQASPLGGAAGAAAGAVVILHDLTEVRRLEQVRRDFVANVSHELKTPVTAIRGMAETLLDDAGMERASGARFLGKIIEQCRRLADLVNALLTLSRVESRREGLAMERLDLRQPVQEALAALKPVSERLDIDLQLHVPAAPVSVLGDAEALMQVVSNLLNNALNSTPGGGRVDITVSQAGAEALVEVADSGVGIEPRHLQRIFERFYRVDDARSREHGGSGLGLAIVKHICQAHGGRVTVDSRPGEGSRFSVSLPGASTAV